MKPARRRATTRNFHLPLPEEIHEQIRREAERAGRPATVLVREAVCAWLEERRKAELESELAAYAAKWGGSEIDLDRTLERSSADSLRRRGGARR